jgi:Flp pilus assembly pilin Flp
MSKLVSFFRDENGAIAIEYGFIGGVSLSPSSGQSVQTALKSAV